MDYRRPFAAAVMSLAGLNAREKEQIVPILASPNEEGFMQLPDAIVRGTGTVPVPRAMGLSLGVRILTGNLAPLLQEEVHSGFAAAPQVCHVFIILQQRIINHQLFIVHITILFLIIYLGGSVRNGGGSAPPRRDSPRHVHHAGERRSRAGGMSLLSLKLSFATTLSSAT